MVRYVDVTVNIDGTCWNIQIYSPGNYIHLTSEGLGATVVDITNRLKRRRTPFVLGNVNVHNYLGVDRVHSLLLEEMLRVSFAKLQNDL